MMNKHIFFDRLTAGVAALLTGKRKFFERSIDSQPFHELVTSMGMKVPVIRGEGTHEITASFGKEKLSAAFRVEKWMGSDHPTILYHHGNNERPFDYRKGAKNTFLTIFVRERERIPANLVVVRAPFHDLSIREYQEKMLHLRNFMMMLAVSTRINEEIIRRIREKGKGAVLTTGISLGGWVTNLHRSFYNTSTTYAPLMAGTYLAELFLESRYRKLTGKSARENPGKLRALLNFQEEFEKRDEKNLFPLLARYDQYIEYEVQKESYAGHPVQTIEAGHITGAVSPAALRAHILAVLEKTIQP